MNIHNKLKEIGFKKCGYYRSEYSKEDGWKMVRDDIQTITKYKDGKFIKVVDVAVLEDGNTECVEFNDFWAIGNYGMPNDEYVSMLRKRYFEIIRN